MYSLNCLRVSELEKLFLKLKSKKWQNGHGRKVARSVAQRVTNAPLANNASNYSLCEPASPPSPQLAQQYHGLSRQLSIIRSQTSAGRYLGSGRGLAAITMVTRGCVSCYLVRKAASRFCIYCWTPLSRGRMDNTSFVLHFKSGEENRELLKRFNVFKQDGLLVT